MYSLTRDIKVSRLLAQQAPVFVLSLAIAEFLYKFHSFTLECLAFLGTWYLLDMVVQIVFGRQR